LINKGITLRGAGVRTTTLQKTNQGEQEGILVVGPHRWSKIDEASAVNLTTDAMQGAMSVTVANGAGFAPGQFVKLDEDDYTTATWMPMPARIGGNEPEVLATDRLVWKLHARSGATCRSRWALVAQSWDGSSPRSRKWGGERKHHHVLHSGAHHLHDGSRAGVGPRSTMSESA
jgi:hypothetical protein